MKITKLLVENLTKNCITDNVQPKVSFAIHSDNPNTDLVNVEICIGNWKKIGKEQLNIVYCGDRLKPFTEYTVRVKATDNHGETDEATTVFATGRLNIPWQAKWITDGAYKFKEKKTSPAPMTFRKKITLGKIIKKAEIYCTAIGIYKLFINGGQVGQDYFAPGYTSYKNHLQYQIYDVTELLKNGGKIVAVVAGGWAVGSYTHKRVNRIYADRQALLAEIRISYEDGTSEVIGTDESWEVTENGNFRFAEFYDGEIYDATIDLNKISWRKAKVEKLKIKPEITAQYGVPVRAHEEFKPVFVSKTETGELIYDFGQNFAGVIKAKINSESGRKIIFRHSEILQNGELFTAALRSAKATATYIAKDGEQTYSPTFTYMGFRYVGVTGIEVENIELIAVAIYSDIEQNGTFSCSDERLNKLQNNIMWGAKSNFIDIPTDCPQRDERMGWTGDIAVFSPTACYNFDTSRFFDKWLKDMRAEQVKTGGIPVIVPHVKIPGNFESTFTMPIDFWGDSCVLVPWAEYKARGDRALLEKCYPTMKKYVKACKSLARLFSFGKHRYIWHFHHYGDWCAPDGNWKFWMGRGKWTATACMCNSSAVVAKVAGLLGYEKDKKYFEKLSLNTANAYKAIFTDGNGNLKTEFQTAYVLPLYFEMFTGKEREKAAGNLAKLVINNDYKIGTGFPGTPYILFALADNGYADVAYKMLLNESCPSWLYEVKAGATTVWERWDGLKEDGTFNNKDENDVMVSFNHYASGAVGDFLYRRIAGIEPIEGGYKKFKIKPLIGGGLTCAEGELETPYGKIKSSWNSDGEMFVLNISVPACTECFVELPDGVERIVGSGNYMYECLV